MKFWKLALIKLFLLSVKRMFINTTTILSTLEMEMPAWWQQLVINGFSLATGVGLYFVLAAYYLNRFKRFRAQAQARARADDDEEDEDEDEESSADELSAEEEYKQLYYPELNELPERDLTADELNTLSQHELYEQTPQGAVLLKYDATNNIYTYYTDHYQKLNYGTLDTVARKFAITFNCKNICVNAMQEYEKAKKEREVTLAATKLAATAADATTAAKLTEARIFAQFKVYNKVATSPNTNNNTQVKMTVSKDEFFVEKINLFLYKGKMLDYEEEKRRKNVVVDENMNYAMFKKLAAAQAQAQVTTM